MLYFNQSDNARKGNKMTIQELTDKYIENGESKAVAWMWARNPVNSESPNYKLQAVEYCEQIKAKLLDKK